MPVLSPTFFQATRQIHPCDVEGQSQVYSTIMYKVKVKKYLNATADVKKENVFKFIALSIEIFLSLDCCIKNMQGPAILYPPQGQLKNKKCI